MRESIKCKIENLDMALINGNSCYIKEKTKKNVTISCHLYALLPTK